MAAVSASKLKGCGSVVVGASFCHLEFGITNFSHWHPDRLRSHPLPQRGSARHIPSLGNTEARTEGSRPRRDGNTTWTLPAFGAQSGRTSIGRASGREVCQYV